MRAWTCRLLTSCWSGQSCTLAWLTPIACGARNPLVPTIKSLCLPSVHFRHLVKCCYHYFHSKWLLFSFRCCWFPEFGWIVRIRFWYSAVSGFFKLCCLRTLQTLKAVCLSFFHSWKFNKSFNKYHIYKNISSALKKNAQLGVVIYSIDTYVPSPWEVLYINVTLNIYKFVCSSHIIQHNFYTYW